MAIRRVVRMELKKYKEVQYLGHFLNIYETSVGGLCWLSFLLLS